MTRILMKRIMMKNLLRIMMVKNLANNDDQEPFANDDDQDPNVDVIWILKKAEGRKDEKKKKQRQFYLFINCIILERTLLVRWYCSILNLQPYYRSSLLHAAVADMKNSVADRNDVKPSYAGLFIFANLGLNFSECMRLVPTRERDLKQPTWSPTRMVCWEIQG